MFNMKSWKNVIRSKRIKGDPTKPKMLTPAPEELMSVKSTVRITNFERVITLNKT